MIIKEKIIKNILSKVVIICIIIFIILLTKFTFAKYVEQKNGNATAQIAEMKFKINGRYYNSTEEIEFASTITKQNPKVANGILAPGTSGCIPIIIDSTENKVSLEYDISIDLTNKPINLKFYSDSNMINEIVVNNNKIVRKGYIPITENSESKIKYETIYWNWATETGENVYEINENDQYDSEFMDKIMTMQITVKGTQVNENPMYFCGNASIGDIVYYKAPNTDDYVKFMIVNITTDKVEMMPVDEEGYAVFIDIPYFVGYDTVDKALNLYNSIIQKLNQKAVNGFIQKYGYTISTRALTVEDVNKLTGYVPDSSNMVGVYTANNQKFLITQQTEVTILEKNNSTIMEQATSLTKNGSNLLVGDIISVGDIVDQGEITEIRISYSMGSNTNKWYEYTEGNMQNGSQVMDYFKSGFILASRCIAIHASSKCSYCIRFFYNYNKSIYSFNICSDVIGNIESLPNKIVPVISIPSTTHIKPITDENNTNKIIWKVTE